MRLLLFNVMPRGAPLLLLYLLADAATGFLVCPNRSNTLQASNCSAFGTTPALEILSKWSTFAETNLLFSCGGGDRNTGHDADIRITSTDYSIDALHACNILINVSVRPDLFF